MEIKWWVLLDSIKIWWNNGIIDYWRFERLIMEGEEKSMNIDILMKNDKLKDKELESKNWYLIISFD